MSLHDIIDPQKKLEVRRRNAEQVYFQDITNYIIYKLNREWLNGNEISDKIENEYFNFDYNIKKCYNQDYNQILTFINSGKQIKGFNFFDIKNQIKIILDIQ